MPPKGWSKYRFPVMRTCVVCSRDFPTWTKEQATRNRTCSLACRSVLLRAPRAKKPLAERKGRMVECAVCHKVFWRPDAWLRARTAEVMCSRECNGTRRWQDPRFRPGTRADWTEASREAYRLAMSGPNNPAWKGGVTVFRKHGNYSGVRYVRVPDWARPMARKDGYVMEHRLVMAGMCGFLMTRTEVVNHEDHDPTNNAPTNLTLWPDNRTHKLYEWGKCPPGTANRTRYGSSRDTAASSGASPFRAVPS
jgi:hypothetical protein